MTIRVPIRAAITSIAAAAVLATSGLAAAQPVASKLSLSNAQTMRAGSPMQKSSKFANGFPIIIAVAVIAAGVGIYFLVRKDDDKPKSP